MLGLIAKKNEARERIKGEEKKHANSKPNKWCESIRQSNDNQKMDASLSKKSTFLDRTIEIARLKLPEIMIILF